MSGLIHLVPLAAAAVCWWLLYRVNRGRGWFRIGELIFWDCVITVVLYLLWLTRF